MLHLPIKISLSMEASNERTTVVEDRDMMKKPLKEIQSVLHMYVGEGEARYSDNSDRQKYALRVLYPFFEEALFGFKEKFQESNDDSPLKIADLGCATGPNTLAAFKFVLHSLNDIIYKKNSQPREVQAFFNDLPSSDFNDLFKHLEKQVEASCYIAGVPGSFYNVLFPKSSIHFCYSVMALHWLSKVPQEVTLEDCDAYNKGSVWINGGRNEVAEAYARQSQEDLCKFLNCRAHEMVSGGVMFLVLMGRPDSSPPRDQIFTGGEFCGQDFEEAWNELISLGMITAQQKDAFNLPWYFPNADEITRAAHRTGLFDMLSVKVCDVPSKGEEDFEQYIEDKIKFGRMKSNYVKSFVGSLVEAHLGKDLSDKLFDLFAEKASLLMEIKPPSRYTVCLVASLLRK